MTRRLLLVVSLFLCIAAVAQSQPEFDGVARWQRFLQTTDTASLDGLYSSNPPARYIAADGKPVSDISPETEFWQKLVSSGAKDFQATVVGEQDQQGLHIVTLEISMRAGTPNGPRTRYVMEKQAWLQQGGNWRILAANHTDLLKLRPALNRNPKLYDPNADAKSEITEAVTKAAQAHQRVILVFGANWCYDCHVLDQAFRQDDVAPLLQQGFQVVHVDVGEDGKKNKDLADQYAIPINKGIPALAILNSDGKLLYSQKNGEWESARSLDPDDIVAFLNRWKP